jgi:hypothetical protein
MSFISSSSPLSRRSPVLPAWLGVPGVVADAGPAVRPMT